MNRIIKKMLIFIVLFCSILSTRTNAASDLVMVMETGSTLYTIDPGAPTSIEWKEVAPNGFATVRFIINGTGDSAETFKIPFLKEMGAIYFFDHYQNPGDTTNGVWRPISNAADPMDDDTIDSDDYSMYKTLKRGVEYRIVFGESWINAQMLNEDAAFAQFRTLTIEHYSSSDDQTTSPIGGTPIAPGVNPANGSETYPYEIDGTTVINYENLPFHFVVKNGGKEGTYAVKADYENKTVTFEYIYDRRDVGYKKEHPNSPDYNQYGTNTILIHGTVIPAAYRIQTTEVQNGWLTSFDLMNGFLQHQMAVDTTYPNLYVFVQRMTASSYPMYIFHGDADIKMDENAGFVEKTLTYTLMGIGLLFQMILQLLIGKEVTIDGIIFNGFNDTILDFFGGSTGIASTLSTAINYWFNVFRVLAMIFYLIMMIYVGIKIMLASTGEEKGKFKEAINYWFSGLLILFFLPFALKYIIVINNWLVSTLGEGRQHIYTYYNFVDIKKIDVENDNTYIGGDAYTATLDELRKQEADLQQEIRDLSSRIAQVSMDREAGMASLWRELQRITSQDEYVRVYYLYRDLLYDFIPKNADHWDAAVENEYQQKIDELYQALYNAGYTQITRVQWERLMNSQKQLTIELKGLEAELQIVQMQIYMKEHPTDLMGEMYDRAAKTGRFVYAVVWLVLIWQMVFLLMLYYKRIFMVAFLMVIFPLVMITYVKDKLNDGKSQVFDTWFKEYFINIMVQFFHAMIYVILVDTGLKMYQENTNNWLFFFLSIMMLFPVEKIMRELFGLGAKTLNQLGNTISKAFEGIGAGILIANAFRSSKEEKEDKEREKKEKEEEKNSNINRNLPDVEGGSSLYNSGVQRTGEGSNETRDSLRSRPGEGVASTIKRVTENAANKGTRIRKKLKRGFGRVGKVTGAILGATSGLASGGSIEDMAKGISIGTSAGKSLLETTSLPVSYGINKGVATVQNRRIKAGGLDSALGIESGYSEENKQRIRNAVARGNRKARTAGSTAGEDSAWGGEKGVGKININKRNTMPNLEETIEITEVDE